MQATTAYLNQPLRSELAVRLQRERLCVGDLRRFMHDVVSNAHANEAVKRSTVRGLAFHRLRDYLKIARSIDEAMRFTMDWAKAEREEWDFLAERDADEEYRHQRAEIIGLGR